MELQLNQLSDEELVAASKDGDRAAYAALVRRHTRRVYAVCLGVLGNSSDVEDIFQETFVKGLTKMHTLRDNGQFAGWISQIARNLCRDYYRKIHRRRELLERNPVTNETRSDDFVDLHLALEQLPEQHRLPLMLFYFDGKSPEKLAEELNLTKAGACSRLFRARNELRKLLAERREAK
jgi:RNA polymerase sigma-70 factor (ECF subfamily)